MDMFRQQAKWYALGALCVATIFIWHAVFAESDRGVLTIAFLDVGQGDAIFIEAPSGAQALIDGGPNKAVLRELGSVMPFYDRSIDIVIATHPDQDHIGGLPDVFKRYDVDYFLESGAVSETGAYHALESTVSLSGAERVLARRGMKISLGDNASLHILFPDRDVSGMESNDASIIAQLIFGETEVLLTGDAPQKIEKYLAAKDGQGLKSDILKVGHHGSKTSTSELFIGFVSPEYAIISAGANNRYGHPHKEVVDTLLRFGVTSFNTSESGTIIFKSDGTRVWLQ